MESIWVEGPGLTDAGLAPLARLKSLESLHLKSATGVTDAGLAHLAGLTELGTLRLPNTPLDSSGLKILQGLKKLEIVTLSKERLDDRALAELKAALPGSLVGAY